MFLLFGFSIQEFYICLSYCQKMVFVCEFQHTPLRKMSFSSMFHTSCGYEILRIRYVHPNVTAAFFGQLEKHL
jgi:hypothetical protein